MGKHDNFPQCMARQSISNPNFQDMYLHIQDMYVFTYVLLYYVFTDSNSIAVMHQLNNHLFKMKKPQSSSPVQ